MSFWTAAVIMVAIVSMAMVFRTRVKLNAEKPDDAFTELVQRVEKLEKRMANLETIVLEKERDKEFSRL
jgi:hypothetical protein